MQVQVPGYVLGTDLHCERECGRRVTECDIGIDEPKYRAKGFKNED